MNIQTPQMFYRKLFAEAGIDVDTYMDAITHGTFMLKGSASTLQDDFRNWVYTPDTLTRTSDGAALITDAAKTALTAGANVNYSANTDFVILDTGKPASGATQLIGRILGNFSTSNFIGNYWVNTGCGAYRDGTAAGMITALLAKNSTSVSDGVAALVGANVAVITSLDANNGSSQSDHTGIVYDVDSAADHDSATTTSDGFAAYQQNAAYTVGTDVWMNGWGIYTGGAVFAFASNGRPATWEADMKALAATVVARRA